MGEPRVTSPLLKLAKTPFLLVALDSCCVILAHWCYKETALLRMRKGAALAAGSVKSWRGQLVYRVLIVIALDLCVMAAKVVLSDSFPFAQTQRDNPIQEQGSLSLSSQATEHAVSDTRENTTASRSVNSAESSVLDVSSGAKTQSAAAKDITLS
jgi:hypothetical protein